MLKHVRRCKSVIKHHSSTCILSDEEFKNEPDRKELRTRTRTPRRGGVETDPKPKKEKTRRKKKRNKEMDSTELTAEEENYENGDHRPLPKNYTQLLCVQKTNLTACSFKVFSLHSFSSSLLRKKWYATTC